jgi:hypothetical protein
LWGDFDELHETQVDVDCPCCDTFEDSSFYCDSDVFTDHWLFRLDCHAIFVTVAVKLVKQRSLYREKSEQKGGRYGMSKCLEGVPQRDQIGGGTGSGSCALSEMTASSATGSRTGCISSIKGCCICSALAMLRKRLARSAKTRHSRSRAFMVVDLAFRTTTGGSLQVAQAAK